METPADGSFNELAGHFKQIDESLRGISPIAVIFTVYNRMNELEGGKALDDSSLIDNNLNNFSKEKENKDMEQTMSMEQIENLANGGETDINTQASLPSGGASQSALTASHNVFNEKREDRMNVTLNTVVEKMVISQPSAVKRAVGGEKAMGVVKDPAVNFGKFKEATGCDDSKGEPVFSNIPVSETAAALEIYNIYKAAIADATTPVEPNFGKSTGTIRGYKIQKAGEQTGVYLRTDDVVKFIAESAYFVLNGAVEGVQLQLKESRSKMATGSEGAGAKKSKKNKTNPYAGVTSLGVVQRETAIEKMSEYWKEMDTTTHKPTPGFKSKVSCKYFRGVADPTTGKRATTAYKIPLLVDAYECSVVDEGKKIGLGDGSRSVGNSTEFINVNDKTAFESLEASIAEAFAVAMDANAVGGIFDQIREAAKQAEAADASAQEQEFGDMGL